MEFRYYQEEAICSIFEYFFTHGMKGNPIVALPTGTGKSLVIAEFLRRVFGLYPDQRIMMLTHVKELIEQNAAQLLRVWPTAPLGIYSAGLKQKDIILPIVFAGVQSVVNNVEAFGHRDLVIIDECHLLSPKDDTNYQTVLKKLREINPFLKVIGLTATKYRMKQGLLTDGGVFTDVCYDATGVNEFNKLIAEGYISPLIPKRTGVEIDVSGVGMVASDYNNKQLEKEEERIIYEAVKETVELGQDRHSWLAFSSSIRNSELAASMFQSFGVSAAAVHSKLPDEESTRRIRDFKSGHLRCVVNMNKLTTGFDHPPIDLICMLRPTMSPGLWVQMLGRGTRPSPDTDKENCLVLDFAANTRRLGPINDPRIPRKPGKGTGDMPVRICDCGAYNHAAARFCCSCGMEFEFETKIFETASEHQLLRSDEPITEMYDVRKVIYALHEKKNAAGILISPPSIRVSYFCGLHMFREWVTLEHAGFAGKRARDWWRQRHAEEPPKTTAQALQRQNELRVPKRIKVWVNQKHPTITGCEYE